MTQATAITVEMVGALIGAQFPAWAHLPIRPVIPGGWDNRTFRLGDAMLVRLPSARRYAPQVAKEQRWLPRLAPHLPLPIPQPLAHGKPGPGFARRWSVYGWIEGTPATDAPLPDLPGFARDLARFLAALQTVPTLSAPAPGRHNFWRGGALATYDAETRASLAALGPMVPQPAALALWETALRSQWQRPPVWLHGDLAPGNLLCLDGRLVGVIDFGGMAVGDPACDLTIGWTMLAPPARAAFRAALPLDEDTWARAKGWALWKALRILHHAQPDALRARATLAALLGPS